MRLAGFDIAPREIPLAVPYRIAGRSFHTAPMIFVTLHDETGRAGYGSASPVPPLTGDDHETALRALRDAARPALLGADIGDLDAAVALAERACPAARSALAAVDIALHDLHAKRIGLPICAMLGGARRRLPTSVTVGIDDPAAMVTQALRHVARGFRILKVKIGEDAAADLRRLRMIREAVGREVAIRIDANQGYSASDALRVAACLEELGIELFEQPVPAPAVADLRSVSLASPVPVVADEGVKLAADLAPLVAAGAAGGANIKLMKCGGVREARAIDRALSAAGWRALVGCMDESRASIAAAAHFAAAAGSVAWIDLDGHLDLAADPFTGGVEIRDGDLLLSDQPGLGVVFEGLPG